jgi:hypothetical protein
VFPFNKGKIRSEKKKEKKTVISFSCRDPDKFEDLIWGNLGMVCWPLVKKHPQGTMVKNLKIHLNYF